MTRELDEACAKAMGWTNHGGPIGWCMPSGKRVRWGTLPEFSTDPATDAEKVAWLVARLDGGRVECVHFPRGINEARTAGTGNYDLDRHANGATMTEALARLVIAVAEAEAKR